MGCGGGRAERYYNQDQDYDEEGFVYDRKKKKKKKRIKKELSNVDDQLNADNGWAYVDNEGNVVPTKKPKKKKSKSRLMASRMEVDDEKQGLEIDAPKKRKKSKTNLELKEGDEEQQQVDQRKKHKRSKSKLKIKDAVSEVDFLEARQSALKQKPRRSKSKLHAQTESRLPRRTRSKLKKQQQQLLEQETEAVEDDVEEMVEGQKDGEQKKKKTRDKLARKPNMAMKKHLVSTFDEEEDVNENNNRQAVQKRKKSKEKRLASTFDEEDVNNDNNKEKVLRKRKRSREHRRKKSIPELKDGDGKNKNDELFVILKKHNLTLEEFINKLKELENINQEIETKHQRPSDSKLNEKIVCTNKSNCAKLNNWLAQRKNDFELNELKQLQSMKQLPESQLQALMENIRMAANNQNIARLDKLINRKRKKNLTPKVEPSLKYEPVTYKDLMEPLELVEIIDPMEALKSSEQQSIESKVDNKSKVAVVVVKPVQIKSKTSNENKHVLGKKQGSSAVLPIKKSLSTVAKKTKSQVVKKSAVKITTVEKKVAKSTEKMSPKTEIKVKTKSKNVGKDKSIHKLDELLDRAIIKLMSLRKFKNAIKGDGSNIERSEMSKTEVSSGTEQTQTRLGRSRLLSTEDRSESDNSDDAADINRTINRKTANDEDNEDSNLRNIAIDQSTNSTNSKTDSVYSRIKSNSAFSISNNKNL